MHAVFIAFLALPVCAGIVPIPPEYDRLLVEGIDAIYRMQFDKADELARRAIALNPERPHAYLGLAGTAWTRYVYGADQNDPELLKPYEDATRSAVEAGERWIKKHPGDAQGLFALGSAYGLYSRLLIHRREWLRGYWNGRKAIQIIKRAIKADPSLVDAQLGMGMYDYYSDLYPRFIGVLAKIVLRGDRLRGIETLKRVAREGKYSKSNAMILLVEIFTEDPYGAKNPPEAVRLMDELRAKYPESAMMHSAHMVALYAAGRYEEAAKDSRDFLDLVAKGKYDALQEAKGRVILGTCYWALGRKDEALKEYRLAANSRYKGRPTRWGVWALVRAGRLLDILGRREEAVAAYQEALRHEADDQWGLKKLAKAGISRPYEGVPGHTSIPSG